MTADPPSIKKSIRVDKYDISYMLTDALIATKSEERDPEIMLPFAQKLVENTKMGRIPIYFNLSTLTSCVINGRLLADVT